MLPNVIIAGVPKAGTTSIHQWLTDHPDIAGPTVKETAYFVDKTSHAYRSEANFHHQGLAGYERFFDNEKARSARLVLEVAPDYMYQQTALSQLPGLSSTPIIVFVLREPAAQIRSLFHYLQNNWRYVPKSMTFAEFVELAHAKSPRLQHHELLQNAIDNGRYLQHVERWIAHCGEDRVRVYLFDDLIRDSRSFVRKLCTDMNIDPAFYDNYDFRKENETYRVRSLQLQALSVSIRKKLPVGRFYELVRAVYRRLNTSSGAVEKSVPEQAIMRALRQEFATDNLALAERFNLDLDAWCDE